MQNGPSYILLVEQRHWGEICRQTEEGCVSFDSVSMKVKGWSQTCTDLPHPRQVRHSLERAAGPVLQGAPLHLSAQCCKQLQGVWVSLLPFTLWSPKPRLRAITFYHYLAFEKPKCWVKGTFITCFLFND